MGSISSQLQRIEQIEARILSLSDDLAILGADMCADIADRVINKGNSADGSKFSPYSTKEVPAFWYRGRSLNAAGESKIRQAEKKREGVSYKEFREYNNRPTAFKNFSFSQEMWRGFGVKKIQYSGGIYTITIGGKTKVSEERIGWMNGQEGKSIIDPNREELNRLASGLLKKIVNG